MTERAGRPSRRGLRPCAEGRCQLVSDGPAWDEGPHDEWETCLDTRRAVRVFRRVEDCEGFSDPLSRVFHSSGGGGRLYRITGPGESEA